MLEAHELLWVSRYEVLKAHGYLLRPRYRPGWSPTWQDGASTLFEEEAVVAGTEYLDAQRVSDGMFVFLKPVWKSSPEVSILRFLSVEHLRNDPQNHTVPLLDIIDDPVEPNAGVILVFPLFRPIDSPLPTTVRDCLTLVEQTLEGLCFLHRHQVAHRDCAVSNIMMEGRALMPDGWHPEELLRSRDLRKSLDVPDLREVKNHRYYFIDFGISSIQQSLTLGLEGREKAPELSSTTPYDPYKVDIYGLGKTYQDLFEKLYSDATFLQPLIDAMTHTEPSQRPTAEELHMKIKELRYGLSDWALSSRLHLRARKESVIQRARRDFLARYLGYWWRFRGPRSVPIPS